MLITYFQKAVNYVRETHEMALFATMADAEWSAAFRASPLFYIILPFIGVLLTVNALINGYNLLQANNQNFDRWFAFISSVFCAVLASISLYGAAISMAIGFSFVAGPWFFFSSLIVAMSHQLIMLGLNLYRAIESPAGSNQRIHYIQAALNTLFTITLLAVTLGTVLTVMLFPVAPIIGAAFALTAVALNALNLMWRVIPHNGKQVIKGWFGLGKNELTSQPSSDQLKNITPTFLQAPEQGPKHHRLFSHADYSTQIKKMDLGDAKNYLLRIIGNKIKSFEQNPQLQDDKTKNKMSLLKKLSRALRDHTEISGEDLLKRYPLAFQSFWAEKGDVEQLFDAVLVFQEKCQERQPDMLAMKGIS